MVVGVPVDYRDNHRLMEIVHPNVLELRTLSKGEMKWRQKPKRYIGRRTPAVRDT